LPDKTKIKIEAAPAEGSGEGSKAGDPKDAKAPGEGSSEK
jgi:hypothetical protein